MTRPDGVHEEYLKHGSNQLFLNISDILNKTSETGEYPKGVRLRRLNPLAKSQKKNEKVNMRPIILLSPMRKILTISLIDRCWGRMKKHIPLSQVACHSDRSRTKQLFAIKILAGKPSPLKTTTSFY